MHRLEGHRHRFPSELPGIPPLQSDLQPVQTRPRNDPFVLQHADDDAGCDSLLVGKCLDRKLAIPDPP